MEEIQDCLGKLICKVDASCGFVHRYNSKELISAYLSPGDRIAFEIGVTYTELELREDPYFYVTSLQN